MAIYFQPHPGQITVFTKKIFSPETLSDYTLQVVRVVLTEDQVRIAEEVAKKRACEQKRGPWGSGLIELPSFSGNCGDIAVALITGQPFDEVTRVEGDDGDFIAKDGNPGNVKAALSNYGKLLVRCTDQYGQHDIPNDHKYWHSYYVAAIYDLRSRSIEFLGYATKKEVQSAIREKATSKKGQHFNRAVPHEQLHDIREIIDLVDSPSLAVI